MFEDIPLDTRHHVFKNKPKFPKGWYMTEDRRKEIQAARAQSFLMDRERSQSGTLVDGVQRIEASLTASRAPPLAESGLAETRDKFAELLQARPSPARRPSLR